ncbi:MAG TPA: hypothetical protein VMH61_01230 [Candidatus Acidoferrales bacterium]|nr:hypothetical protein [Candidatus Acidoferrales bacterium]
MARDPWALAVALSALPLLVATRRAPLGEPFADDFLFLDFSVLHRRLSWWGGGGADNYWRPLARQAYYGVLGPLMLSHPAWIGALHVLALVAAGVLIQRALRPHWPGPLSAAAGAFPLGLESARVLIAWPAAAQDLGALFFLALAFHAFARGRAVLLALAAVAAALCKEVAAPLALLVGLAPLPPPARGARGMRVALVAALAAWGVARLAVQSSALHGSPSGAGTDGAGAATLLARVAGSLGQVTLDAFSLGARARGPGAPLAIALLVGAPLAFAIAFARVRTWWRWSAWGLAWWAVGSAPLALFLPDWAPFRSVLPAVGLGITILAPFTGRPVASLLPVVGLRLATLLAAPGDAPLTTTLPPRTSAFMDFEHMAREQHFMRSMRSSLRAAYPSLPHGAVVARANMPRGLLVAFEGNRALQCWYRDTTLRLAAFEDVQRAPTAALVTVAQFQSRQAREVALVRPDAALLQSKAIADFRAGRYDSCLGEFTRADSLEPDPRAVVFHSESAGARAYALGMLERYDAARAEALRARAIDADNINARLVLVILDLGERRYDRAEALLDSLLADAPTQTTALEMQRTLRALRNGQRSPPGP